MHSRDVKTIADEFNEFFSTVGAREAEAPASLAVTHDLPKVTSPMVFDQNTPESEKFHFQAVSENEIKRIVMSLQSNKTLATCTHLRSYISSFLHLFSLRA